MDLFHAITQEIESVISCHWLSEFRDSTRSNRSSAANTPRGPRSQSVTRPSTLSRSSSSESDSGSSVLSRTSSIAEQAKMSDKLMETEKGGEQTQYESIQTVTKEHSKEGGQLGGGLSGTTTNTSGVDSDRGEKTAENVRYGQNISESGIGGMTITSSGEANHEGGYGGTKAQETLEGGKNPRTQQGYSAGKDDHSYNVGA